MTDTITQLRALAREVRNYQLERDWSDTKLCKEIAHVGSSKTYKRILDETDDLEELNVETQLRNYQAAAEYLSALRAKDRPVEAIYKDFSNILDVEAAVVKAMTEETVARLVMVEGFTATGKDESLKHIQSKWPNTVLVTEADELWRDSLNAPTAALYCAVGLSRGKMPRYPMERMEEIKAELRKRKVIVAINEAHHMGVRGLNMVKTLINQTPTVFALFCHPTLMTRMLSSSYEETSQLTGNRLFEKVELPTPPANEILQMLERRGVKFSDSETKNTAAKTLAGDAPHYGNWRFVSQVTRKLVDATKRGVVALKDVSAASSAVKAMRTRIVKQQEA